MESRGKASSLSYSDSILHRSLANFRAQGLAIAFVFGGEAINASGEVSPTTCVANGGALCTTCGVINLNVTRCSRYADGRARIDLSVKQLILDIDGILR